MSGLFSVSERLHSGLILLAELAAAPERVQSLHDIGERMQLSQGYLEEIVALLRQAGLVEGKRGGAGGYLLTQDPAKISLLQIVTALEGGVTLVPCQANGAQCEVSPHCRTKRVWSNAQTKMLETLQATSLKDVVAQNAV